MLTPPALVGDLVRLELIGPDHIAGLAAAAAVDRSSYRYTWVPDGVAATEEYVAAARADWQAGASLPFAVIDRRTAAPVGSTRIYDWAVLPGGEAPNDADPPTVSEIGYTWYAAPAQRTGINSETKLLLLTHLFEAWPGVRVTLKTDSRNQRSRTAIERLGAHFDGVLRAHGPASDGGIRDTAFYSILTEEWPEVRAGLQRRLHHPAPLRP